MTTGRRLLFTLASLVTCACAPSPAVAPPSAPASPVPAPPARPASAPAPADTFPFPRAAVTDPAKLAEALPALAREVGAAYREEDPDKRLSATFRLQLLAGAYAQADATLAELRALRASQPRGADPSLLPYAIYLKARQAEAKGQAFDETFRKTFREIFVGLDDKAAYDAGYYFSFNLARSEAEVRGLVEAQKDKDAIALADALRLVRADVMYEVYRRVLPLSEALVAESDHRRYAIEDDVRIPTRDGGVISATVVRPAHAAGPLPALLNFSIYTYPWKTQDDAVQSAAHGYVGVVAYARGKRVDATATVPYEHDGKDAYDVIDWISKQPWGNGKVGMFGGSYEGFTQWAAAKKLHPALKALMPSVPVAPGIDVPMEGNVFLTFTYSWIPYVTNTTGLDDAAYGDEARWKGLTTKWFASGKPYRALDEIDGHPSPLFRRWLQHPSYDTYWQSMIPYRQEFATIDIPVLTTTGYYDGCSFSALYYLREHTRYNPHAEHYLVIGPYDHRSGQHRSDATLRGYTLDPAAAIDFHVLRYQWFDYTLRGGPKPERLKDRINYEVMGANEWKHAPGLEALGPTSRTFYLSAAGAAEKRTLAAEKPAKAAVLEQEVDLAERTTVNDFAPDELMSPKLAVANAFAFESEPVTAPVEVTGFFGGQLDFTTNKKDLDFSVGLYELTPKGEYLFLSYYLARASYVRDRSQRHLLQPGKLEHLAFRSGRPTSRQIATGSRFVVVLGVNKQAGTQLDYGTGRDVSDESMADAKVPLRIQWQTTSHIDIPIGR